ncbi:bifunctional 4-hydroxy-2-oxoglutarate aldolase/2-dehydro-3-deoxy-phosphogluconate aldolase [Candidatus Aerophobetes bacterium]|nr:bifunctional 4-hydroxy-2-oxoglutarate aldolase/2-dehydro-3-deoxy-phosphogluconate aldolase [Candidatus Aerophobetes bacterium]
MSKKGENLNLIFKTGIIAIIRAESSAQLLRVASALKEGGIKVIEVAMTTPDALKVIEEISGKLKEEILMGAGTVLDPETARSAILAGAEFIVSPTLNKEVINLAHRYSKLIIPGAFTPTEILLAWEEGADLVKVFPAGVSGPSYIKALRGPLPQICLVPVGGVNLDNVANFIRAGAFAVGVGSSLVKKEFLKEENFKELTNLSKRFIEVIKKAKEKE